MSSSQLALDIVPRIPYSAKGFVSHHGVSRLLNVLEQVYSSDSFYSCYIIGAERSGKTHLGLFLSELLFKDDGIYLDGDAFDAALVNAQDFVMHCDKRVLVIDDSHTNLQLLVPGASGPFVAFHEAARLAGKILILISSVQKDELPCDMHVMSRLNMAQDLTIGNPDESDVPALVRALVTQRGLQLSERKLDYLARRLRPDVFTLEKYVNAVEAQARANEKVSFEILESALRSVSA